MVIIWQPLLVSFLTSFITTMLGYFRTVDPKDFEIRKFITTIIIGVVVATVGVLMQWDYTQAQTWLAQAGLTVWIYWAVNGLVNWVHNTQVKPA